MSCLSRSSIALAIVFAATFSHASDIVFENPWFRAVLGDDAGWRSLVHKSAGAELRATEPQTPLADIRIGDQQFQANGATRNDVQLTVTFRGCDTRLVYVVTTADDWIVFRLRRTEGKPTAGTMASTAASTATSSIRRRRC